MKTHTTAAYLINPEHPVTVQVIGCGGNGSQVLTQLARINEALKKLGHLGIHVTCFDNDIITEANMGRQLFSPSELGMNKAVALITRLNRFFGTSWKAMPILFNSKVEILERRANITISCVDSIATRIEIEKCLMEKLKKNHGDPYYGTYYWMDLGNTQNSGQFILGSIGGIEQPERIISKASTKKVKATLGVDIESLFVSTLPNVFEKFPAMKKQKEKESGPSCSLAEALDKQDLFINSTLSQLAMGLLWKLFREGKINYHGAFVNLETLKIAPIYI
ncbi:MAG: PRTRC system ThiF family protein [Bacteroidetes bacterium]|nr:PRTRC system ThiF family protein [Bacteroidota bacterium]